MIRVIDTLAAVAHRQDLIKEAEEYRRLKRC